MIAEGEEFELWVENTLFGQKVADLSFDSRLHYLFDKAEYRNDAYVVFCHDLLWRLTEAAVAKIFNTFWQERVIVTEVMVSRGHPTYSRIADSTGYSLRRCKMIPSPVGEIAAMEFHHGDNREIVLPSLTSWYAV